MMGAYSFWLSSLLFFCIALYISSLMMEVSMSSLSFKPSPSLCASFMLFSNSVYLLWKRFSSKAFGKSAIIQIKQEGNLNIVCNYRIVHMSSEKVIAISAEAVDCGKRVSDTKKKFIWKFTIGEQEYCLQLVSSTLSGKRIVYLNSQQIYSQQNVFNINFDFTHSIEGHSIRITRGEESINSFDIRIDNRSFDYLIKKRMNMDTEGKKQEKQKKTSKFEQTDADPFSEFSSFASQIQQNPPTANDPFGDFTDFDNFDFKKVEKKMPEEKVEKEAKGQNQIVMENIFDTNSLKNIADGLSDDLLSGDFTTNAFGLNNNYLDLVNSREAQSEQYGYVDPMQKKTTVDKMKLDMTGKQIVNRTKATAEELKMKAADFFDSLL